MTRTELVLLSVVEQSFSAGDALALYEGTDANHFRVALDVSTTSSRTDQNWDDIIRGKLIGVRGISDDKRIVVDWFGSSRDAMLVMPTKDVTRLNKITKVEYDNPRTFLENGMSVLNRIYGGGKNPSKSDLQRVIYNLLEASFNTTSNGQLKHDMSYVAGHQTLAITFSSSPVSINSAEDLAKWIQKTVKSDEKYTERKGISARGHYWDAARELSLRDWVKLIEQGLETVGKVYSSEGEWLLGDDTLNIPPGSKLFLLTPSLPDPSPMESKFTTAARESWETFSSKILPKLKRKYRVITTTAERFKRLQNAYWSKLAAQRQR